jgi:rhamnogalacturonan endolyase
MHEDGEMNAVSKYRKASKYWQWRIASLGTIWAAISLMLTGVSFADRYLEQLDRGLVAIPQDHGGVFLSWRLLRTDDGDVGFNVYRQSGTDAPVKLNDAPLTAGTNYVDASPDMSHPISYFVRTVLDGAEGEPSKSTTLQGSGYLSIPTALPGGYHANDASVGDLDGDGQYEIIVHAVARGRDNSQGGLTDPPLFYAYRLDGTLMWTINLGKNIREGAHYVPFIVYDLDCDGRAEFICRTADGSADGQGHIIGDAEADWRVTPDSGGLAPQVGPIDPDKRPAASGERPRRGRGGAGVRVRNDVGKILSGPEYLTVFDGRTGAAVDSVTYLPQRAPGNDNPSREQMSAIWGDNYGNRIDRFLSTVAYLDGERPSVVMARGYYTRTVIVAWDLRAGKLEKRWVFDSDAVEPADSKQEKQDSPWRGQGNHSISTADVDDDGKDEIIYGAMVIDDDGSGLYSTRLGHGDAQHTSDLDPTRPGLEIWSIHENENATAEFIGAEMRDARTGEILFVGTRGHDVGRGMAADIDPRYLGYEVWGGSNQLLNARGEAIGPRPRSQNMAIWWDGDLLRELLDGVNILKWDYHEGRENIVFDGRRLGLAANNGSKSNPCLSTDILGDWREELVARTADNRELRIYVSTIPTAHRLVTLMHDPQYRIGVCWQNVGYNQPPHPSFFLGAPIATPP